MGGEVTAASQTTGSRGDLESNTPRSVLNEALISFCAHC